MEGRGLGWRRAQEAVKEGRLATSLSTPESVQKLQAALHAKAKGDSNFRFYALYDKVHRSDVLAHAYECCRLSAARRG